MNHHLLAQLNIIGDSETYTVENPAGFKFTSVTSVITGMIPYIFAIAGIGLLIMIVLAGFTLLTSSGDTKKMEAGKNMLTNAIVGFLIIFVAYWIVQYFGIAFGLTEIQTIFK